MIRSSAPIVANLHVSNVKCLGTRADVKIFIKALLNALHSLETFASVQMLAAECILRKILAALTWFAKDVVTAFVGVA